MSEVRDWQLERYLLGELPDAELQAVRAALERDAGLRERLAALERSNEELLARHPPRVVAPAISGRAAGPAPRPRSAPRLAFAAALGMAALAVGLSVTAPWREERLADPILETAGDTTRIKGGPPRLVLYRRGTAGSELLASGATARQRDVVQIGYQAAGRRYGVIVSIDGRGAVTRHLPVAGPSAAELAAGSVVLPQAYELDDAPRFERFHFIAADQPFEVETVLQALRASPGASPPAADGRLDLPAGWDQSSLLLKKE
jgi:hypothetical protein